jgi:hypothetical protein
VFCQLQYAPQRSTLVKYHHAFAEAHYLFRNHQVQISDELHEEKYVGPTYGLTTSLEVGPGATVDTLQTGYRRIQAPS